MYTDPKELKRQRDREYYARNKDEIQKRRREASAKKQASTALHNEEQNLPHTPLSITQSNDGLLMSQSNAMAATPANIDVQATETQTPVSMTLGNDEALLHTHLILSLLPFKLLSCMQILKKQGGRNRGCIMHKIESQY